MKTFYKIVDGKTQIGSGFIIPTGFIEYTKGEEPQDLINGMLFDEKTKKTNEINTNCGNEIENGFVSNALGNDYNYKSEQIDQLNLIGMVTAGTDDYFKAGVADVDGNITWNYELHTIAQLTQVLQDGKAHKQVLLQKANDLKLQIANATTLDELDLIGW